jgi:hypothetical protein
MFNRTTVAKAFVTAACALAIALLTIGIGVNSAWAGSDQTSRPQVNPISSDVISQPVTAPDDTVHRFSKRWQVMLHGGSSGPLIASHFDNQLVQSGGVPLGGACPPYDDDACASRCCDSQVCVTFCHCFRDSVCGITSSEPTR